MDDLKNKSLEAHKSFKGKLEINSKVSLENIDDMSIFYTPGVAEPCKEIFEDESKSYDYTSRGNLIAVVTDGSAVLGLGNIGALAGMPVMEGKCALFKKFADVDAFPIALNTQDTEEIIATIKNIADSFGGINLEDISAPKCFEIEKRLIDELSIPVFHDDQHGTAIVCLAGLINSLKIVGKEKERVRVVINGAGAAGIAICKLMLEYGFKNISLLDSKGMIFEGREGLNDYKKEISHKTNLEKKEGELGDAVMDADIFIGVSAPNVLTADMVRSMSADPIIFAMANPDPEIMPEDAKEAGAAIIATGRSDFPNQINNVLVFPGIFKGALSARVPKITTQMKINAAKALASTVSSPRPEKIIPDVFDPSVADVIANSVKE
ncbi:NAD-dependent malic enzyme [Candidatus Peregrinibacteria bacterium]|nr:NAD-dependent malic enzyme [Candidatus Peregrinibacteria bacterium]